MLVWLYAAALVQTVKLNSVVDPVPIYFFETIVSPNIYFCTFDIHSTPIFELIEIFIGIRLDLHSVENVGINIILHTLELNG